jgi:CHAD domain-containing protein
MLSRARQLIEEIRMRLLIRRIRKDLEFFGYDVSHFTDQQLLDQVGLLGHHLADASRVAGLSLEQMAANVTYMAAAFKRMEELDDG